MHLLCHRCGHALGSDASFCSQCGAPQVHYAAQVPVSLLESAGSKSSLAYLESNGEEGRGSEGPGQQGGQQGGGRTSYPENCRSDSASASQNSNQEIQWKYAIRVAAGVSLLVGLLTSILAMGSLLWIMGGAVLVIALYRRRFPYAILQARLGARIGLVTGTMTATAAVAGNTLLLVIQRYGLNQGNLLDAALSSTMQQAMTHAATGSEAQAQMNSATAFLLSPEGRAGMVMMGMGCIAAMIMILSVAGSVLGTQYYRKRGQSQPIG